MTQTAGSAGESGSDDQSMKPGGPRGGGLLGRFVRHVRGVVPGLRDPHDQGQSASLADLVRDHGPNDEALSEDERRMLLNLLKFRTQRVEDVMVPRADIIAIEASTPLPEVLDLFKQAGHSRMPVYRESLDDPIGMVHLKDVVQCFPSGSDAEGAEGVHSDTATHSLTANGNGMPPLTRIKRDVLFVPPSMPAMDLLLQMQGARIHMALVIDEYGGTDGLVTIEDLIEMIIGDIEDEHDRDSDPICEALEAGGYLVDARLEIDDFQELSGFDLSTEDGEGDEVDTMGGLVFTLVGRVPRRGEIIAHPNGFDIEIVEADARRIRRMKIVPTGVAGPVADSAAPV